MRNIKLPAKILLVTLIGFAAPSLAQNGAKTPAKPGSKNEIILDAIVATVNEKPITLSDLGNRLNPPRAISMEEASHDPQIREVLDSVILEKLIDEEANSRKMSASDSEINDYITEVARRNNLSKADFEKELSNEGKDLTVYKQQVKADILRSKLISTFAKGGASVSEDEIDDYLKNHPELMQSGVKVKLRQILVATSKHSDEEAGTIMDKVEAKLHDGESFESIAKQMSDGDEASDGGSLGVMAEKDLSSEIFDAVFAVKPGEVSPIVKTSQGLHIFKVEERYGTDDSMSDEQKQQIRSEVRKTLLSQRSNQRMDSFITGDLYKHHTVDKKI